MVRLNPEQLLNLVDQAAQLTPLERASTMLSAVAPHEHHDQDTPGERNAKLLRLRIDLFGPLMTCLASCPYCTEQVEIAADAAMLASVPYGKRRVEVEYEGKVTVFRLPTLTEIGWAASLTGAEQTLYATCAEMLDDDARLADAGFCAAIDAAFDHADPLGMISLEADCPACGAGIAPLLDVGDHLWREVAAYARRIEDEVDVLARIYGWSERDILSLPERRRARYLERAMT